MKLLETISKWLSNVAAIIVLLIAAIILTDVGARAVNRPLPGMVEITEASMVLVVFLGLAYVHVTKGHISVGVFVDRLSARSQAIVDAVVFSLSLLYAVVLTWQGFTQFLSSIKTQEVASILMIPMYPVRLTVPIGCALLSLVMAYTVYDAVRRILKR